jgi:hypothetical protein
MNLPDLVLNLKNVDFMIIKRFDKVVFPTHEEGRVLDILQMGNELDWDYKVKIHKPGKTYHRGEVISVKVNDFKKIPHG